MFAAAVIGSVGAFLETSAGTDAEPGVHRAFMGGRWPSLARPARVLPTDTRQPVLELAVMLNFSQDAGRQDSGEADMDVQMFRSFEGRIGRQSWWIGTLIMIAVSIVLCFILVAIMGSGRTSMDPQKVLEPGFLEGYTRNAALMQLIMLVIVIYAVAALMAKRLETLH